MNVTISGKDAAINWGWVREELAKKERLNSFDKKLSSSLIQRSVDECAVRAEILARTNAVSARLRIISSRRGVVKLERGIVFTGKRLAEFLSGAQFVRLFLVTIGENLEHTATLLMHQGEHLHGYILDRIGSFAVESAANHIEIALRQKYELNNKSVSMRISPGYCDWPIEEQAMFSRALDFGRCGVSLTKSFMMVPKKSISGLVAVAPKGSFSATGSPCSACTMRSCSYRR